MTTDRPHDNLTEVEMRQFWNAEDHLPTTLGGGVNWSPIFRVVESIIAARTSDLIERLQAAEAKNAQPDWWYQDMAKLLEERQAADMQVIALRDGIRSIAENLEREHQGAFGEHLSSVFPHHIARQLRALLREDTTNGTK